MSINRVLVLDGKLPASFFLTGSGMAVDAAAKAKRGDAAVLGAAYEPFDRTLHVRSNIRSNIPYSTEHSMGRSLWALPSLGPSGGGPPDLASRVRSNIPSNIPPEHSIGTFRSPQVPGGLREARDRRRHSPPERRTPPPPRLPSLQNISAVAVRARLFF